MPNSEPRPSVPRGLAIAALCALIMSPVPALAQSSPLEQRLREALRAATQQQRALEDENATLRAKQAEQERQVQQLTAKAGDQDQELQQLRQAQAAGNEEQDRLRRSLADATAKLEAGSKALADAQATLGKWEAAYKQAADVARTRDADAKRLDAQLNQTTQRANACEAKNGELFKLGNEILTLYEKKGPFASLLEREPVTQLKRVQLENLVQDYQDKLLDQKVIAPAQ